MAGNNGSMGSFIHMLSALHRVLERNKTFSPVFIMNSNDMGTSGKCKLDKCRKGLWVMKLTNSRASDQLSAITGATTSMPCELMSKALGFMTI
jgi:hypothetical protein